MESCRQSKSPWIHPVTIFALETAARRGEILNLAWKDVDLEGRTARLSGKTGERKIPLSPPCLSLLKALPRGIGGKVFPVSVDTLRQAFERAVKRSGIDHCTFHDLRHDALTRMAKLGLNVLELRAVSGHSSASQLQRYVKINANDLALKLASKD